jgi:curli production assembly/transport component CsgG
MVVRLLSLFLLVTLLSSCAAIQPIDEPVPSSVPLIDELYNMPAPERKVPIAVYKFNDVTGQRKSGNNLALLSSAVTQGGDIWLLQALKKAEKIRPLLFAGVLLTGGIVGYDTNTETGGLGVRYLGIGISDEYRKDMVTVALRLISVQTGEVLLAVSSQKTILSTKLSATVFKFLDMGTSLLETEAGITDNESTTYAVRKAIEQAVIEIIKEGEKKKLWKFKKEEIK